MTFLTTVYNVSEQELNSPKQEYKNSITDNLQTKSFRTKQIAFALITL